MSDRTETTVDHTAIRAWAMARGGHPAVLPGAADLDGEPVLRIAFKDDEAEMKKISWDEFFRLFDEGRLVMIHGGETDPGHSHKLVSRVEAEEENG